MIGYTWPEETVEAAAKIMGATNETFRFYWPYILFNPWPVVGHCAGYAIVFAIIVIKTWGQR